MFLTLEDPRAKVQGSRDPLGIQPIWSRFGREVVTAISAEVLGTRTQETSFFTASERRLSFLTTREPFQLKTYAQMYQAFSHQGLKRGNDCWLTIEGECMRLKHAGQLTQDPAHFREQAEAWLADVLGEEAAAFVVDRPRG